MSTEHCQARLAVVGLVALSLKFPGIALAAADLPQPVVVSPVTTLIKLAVATALVCAIFWAAARVMKRLQGASVRSHGRLRIVDSLSVGQRERVLIIQAGDEQMVVGVTGHQINMLHTLASPIENAESAIATTQPNDFRQKLQTALKRHVSA